MNDKLYVVKTDCINKCDRDGSIQAISSESTVAYAICADLNETTIGTDTAHTFSVDEYQKVE